MSEVLIKAPESSQPPAWAQEPLHWLTALKTKTRTDHIAVDSEESDPHVVARSPRIWTSPFIQSSGSSPWFGEGCLSKSLSWSVITSRQFLTRLISQRPVNGRMPDWPTSNSVYFRHHSAFDLLLLQSMVKGPPVLEDVVEFVNSIQEGLSDNASYMLSRYNVIRRRRNKRKVIFSFYLLSLIFWDLTHTFGCAGERKAVSAIWLIAYSN